jgi:ABC-type bacteriocin/lantibiotic exporter with double-glycine peptidase domain
VAGALTSGIQLGAPLAVLVFGAFQVLRGDLSLGMMLTLSALAVGFLTPLSNLVATALQLREVRSHVERIEDVLGAAPEQAPGPRKKIELRGRITVSKVSFRYGRNEPWVLQDIDLDILPGQKMAIVGKSGSGKSTLARLLVGLHVPESGRILYDGEDLAGLDLRSLRSQIGVVTQDARVFALSLRANIALAEPAANWERIVEAARMAEIHEEIASMALGYDTVLSDGGGSLSGGQRQRLALARALVRRPPVLLLDEATSDLDAVTESRVMANLAALRCTRIVIAHRLSTIADSDAILVLEGGTVTEIGTHRELLRRGGSYAQLVAAQTAPS